MEQGSIGEIPQIKFSTSPSISAFRDDSVMQILNCFGKEVIEILSLNQKTQKHNSVIPREMYQSRSRRAEARNLLKRAAKAVIPKSQT